MSTTAEDRDSANVFFDDYQHLRFERHDHGVLMVVLNRPESKNRYNFRMRTELERVWIDIGADPETRVALLTGEGSTFSSGADYGPGQFSRPKGRLDTIDGVEAAMKRMRAIIQNMIDLDKPIVSAIRGRAFGGAMTIALTADISIAAADAQLAEKHLATGLTPPEPALIWPMLISMAKTKFLLMTDATVSGAEAERIGLVSLAVPDAEVLPTALRIAEQLGRGPQLALRLTKRSLNGWYSRGGPTFDLAIAYEMLCQFHPDADEAVAAMLAKRSPKYQ